MSETVPESFDLGKFKEELAQATEAYTKASYLTFKKSYYSKNATEQRELYGKLLDICAKALIETQGDPATMAEIDRILIRHRHGDGYPLFPADSASQFYKELAMRVAKK